MTQKSAMRGVPVDLQVAGSSSGNGVVLALPTSFGRHTILITCSAGIVSGAIQPEYSNNAADANTWAPLGGGPINLVASTDIEYSFEGIFPFIRARFSTPASGGTAEVQYVGSGM